MPMLAAAPASAAAAPAPTSRRLRRRRRQGRYRPISSTMAPRSVPAAAPADAVSSRPVRRGSDARPADRRRPRDAARLAASARPVPACSRSSCSSASSPWWRCWRCASSRRGQPATPGGRLRRCAAGAGRARRHRAGAAPRAGRPSNARDEIGIGSGDLDTFERLLGEIQTAYGRETGRPSAARTMPEAGAVLREELRRQRGARPAQRGRGRAAPAENLAEAWREGDTDYATVAMRYRSRDATVECASGRVVEGDAQRPTETKEVWTFARSPRPGLAARRHPGSRLESIGASARAGRLRLDRSVPSCAIATARA